MNILKITGNIGKKLLRTISLLGKIALCLPEMHTPDVKLHLDVNSHPCFLGQKTNVIITIRFWII